MHTFAPFSTPLPAAPLLPEAPAVVETSVLGHLDFHSKIWVVLITAVGGLSARGTGPDFDTAHDNAAHNLRMRHEVEHARQGARS